MKRLSAAASSLVLLLSIGYAQNETTTSTPFTLTWTQGRCLGCKIAAGLGRVQFLSRKDVWAVGPKGDRAVTDVIVVHSSDAGRTWREIPGTRQYAGDPDGPPAFSFLDSMRGWIAWWNRTDEPQMMGTRDGGRHWSRVSERDLQRMQMVDDSRGYGSVAGEFYRTNDGGRSWSVTKIPEIVYIDHLLFLTPELGWISGGGGVQGTDFFVFRTVNGGRDWEASRSAPPRGPAGVSDLYFRDPQRGWLVTWGYNDDGSYLYSTVDGGKHWVADPDLSFQGKGRFANVVRFTSEERGFVFVNDNGQNKVVYTVDGGRHWHKQPLAEPVFNCQVFEGDLLCSGGLGFRLLTVHPQ